jgi:hypothetical protein
MGGQGDLILSLPGPLGHANRPRHRQHSALHCCHTQKRRGWLYLDIQKRFTLIHDFGHIELDILLSLLKVVQRGLRIENKNLLEIRLLLLVVLCNVSI